MNRTLIGRQSAALLILALCALVALLVRRDYLTRRILTRTINDIIEGAS